MEDSIKNYITEVIKEYKDQNKNDCITEEEMTGIFGTETFYPNHNLLMSEWTDTSWWTIFEWEDYYVDYGTNNTEYDDYDININIEIDLGEADQLVESDQLDDIRDEYYDDLIDKYYGTSTSRINIDINSGQEEANDENYITLYGCDLGYADCINQGEWESELQDELESLPYGMRTKTVDVYVTDADEAIKWYCSDLNDTTLHLRIHCDCGDGKFLIIKTRLQQFYYYGIYLEFEYDKNANRICLGTSINVDAVYTIIMHYINTGNCLGAL